MTARIDTSRGSFTYKLTGPEHGPPLVLVAGLADDLDSWDGVLPGLGDYRCITFDNRGIGGSPITDGPYTAAQMAEDAHAITQAFDLTGIPVIGSSMGGAICQEWALRYPRDISHLILTNTWGRTDEFCQVIFEHWIALAQSGQAEALWDSVLLFCFSPGFLHDHPATVDEFRNMPIPDLHGFAAGSAACRDHSTLGRLHAIRQPTLIIAGMRDILTAAHHSELIAHEIPYATLEHIDAAHLIFAEQPEQWVKTVREWLE